MMTMAPAFMAQLIDSRDDFALKTNMTLENPHVQ